jgi:DNA repair exonuclease SbcCD ATPase subunit
MPMKITIDALYLLLLCEFSLILLISTIYLFSRNKKHKRLYQKALKELSDIKSQESGVRSQQEGESKAVEFPQVEPQPMQETPSEISEGHLAVETVESPQLSADTTEALDEGSLVGKINKLQRIINFQKGKIIDLMCYKDILEGAQKRLSSIQDSYRNLKDRFVKLFGESPENKGLAEAMETFESNNNELISYIEILGKENESLAEKFRLWEEELKQIWEEAEKSEIIDEGRYDEKLGEIMHEKEELAAKLKEFEDKLQEKTKLFEEMQKQYEDLEKEYMILYRQQQQQQG